MEEGHKKEARKRKVGRKEKNAKDANKGKRKRSSQRMALEEE